MIKRRELGLSTHAWGEASVLATEINLIYRGYKVFKPSIDDGVDLAIIHGTQVARLQVKCSSLISKTRGEGEAMTYYEFSLTSVRAKYGSESGVEIRTRKFSDEVDFVVLHGVDEDKYWIVPATLLDGRKSATIYSVGRSRPDIDWDDVRTRRESGETLRQIGESIGLSASAVMERLRGTTKEAGTKIVNQLRSYENDWDSIGKFFEASTATEGG